MARRKIVVFRTSAGRLPFAEFLDDLIDRRAVARIKARLRRATLGNLGDYRPVGGGVIELRIHYGPGYRVYAGLESEEVIVLLCAGDKASQTRDIARAGAYWAEHRGKR